MFTLISKTIEIFTFDPVKRLEAQRRQAAEALVRAKNTSDQATINQAQQRYDLIAHNYEVANGEIPQFRN